MKSHIFIIFFSILIITSTTAFATESQYEKHLAKGIAAVEAVSYSEAVEEFSSALKEKPDDPTATLYLGIAQSRSGDAEAFSTLKKALGIRPKDARTNLELGIYYFNRGMYEEAKDYFETAITYAPDREFSEKAGEYLKVAKSGPVKKAFIVNTSGGIQYDSNVVLNTAGSPLPQGISHKSDWRAVFYLQGRYNIIRSHNAEGAISYSLYQNIHTTLSDFDVRQHQLEASMGYRITDMLHIKGSYTFEYTYVGGDDYDRAHSAGASLIITEAPGYSTEIDYRYTDSRFMNADLFLDNSDRSGTNNQIGIAQVIPICKAVSAKIGYYHDWDSTRKDFWDYTGDKGNANLRAIVWSDILLDLNVEYYRKHYDGSSPLSSTGQNREDTTYTGAIAVTKALTDRYSFTLGELYTKNRSNIDAFHYNRAITSIFFNMRF